MTCPDRQILHDELAELLQEWGPQRRTLEAKARHALDVHDKKCKVCKGKR